MAGSTSDARRGQRSPARPPESGDRPTLSIVIVSWNTRELLRECLESVREHPPGCSFDVWVVDNASSDGSADMVRESFPDVRLIANEENLGFAAANNQAIAESRGEFVLLLNSDAAVRSGAIDALLAETDAHPQVGIVGARLLESDGSVQPSCQHAPSPLRDLVHLSHLDGRLPGINYRTDDWDLGQARDVEVVSGACLLARRQALNDAGLLDPGYFMYSEEIELCDRARRAGWRVRYTPHAEVVHHGGASSAAAAERMFMQLYASKVRFYRRNRGPAHVVAFKGVVALCALPRIAEGLVSPFMRGARRDAARERAGRYWRLLRALPGL